MQLLSGEEDKRISEPVAIPTQFISTCRYGLGHTEEKLSRKEKKRRKQEKEKTDIDSMLAQLARFGP